jgi:hypothetical protein
MILLCRLSSKQEGHRTKGILVRPALVPFVHRLVAHDKAGRYGHLPVLLEDCLDGEVQCGLVTSLAVFDILVREATLAFPCLATSLASQDGQEHASKPVWHILHGDDLPGS